MNKLVAEGNASVKCFFFSLEDALLQWPVFDFMKPDNCDQVGTIGNILVDGLSDIRRASRMFPILV